MYDLIVIGGGPAGLTATMYAIRKRLDVLLISKDLGGKTNYHLELPDVEQYQIIRGVEVVNKFKSELEYLDFARRLEPVREVRQQDDHFVVHTWSDEALPARAVIVATGTRQRWLNVPGERKYLSRGLCYSAASYAPLFIDKRTVVIGDGELALRSTAELAIVAAHVHLIGPTTAILDTPLGRKLRSATNVTILEGYEVVQILGNGYARRVVVESPQGQEADIPADGMFVEMALIPNSELVAGLVELDEYGRIVVDSHTRTSVPGVFAAGDVTNGFAEQVLVAVGEGVKAALSTYEYLLPML